MADPENGQREAVGAAGAPFPAHLSMVVLAAGDLPALRRFYRTLGWTEREGSSDTLVRFSLANLDLTLYPAAETFPRESHPDRGSAVTLVLPVRSRPEVDRAVSTALHAGGRVVSEPTDQPWGGRSGVVADPEGNRWELLWVEG